MGFRRLPFVGTGRTTPEPPVLSHVKVPPEMLRPLPPEDCAAAVSDKGGTVVFVWGAELAGMTPPPCVELNVAALPENTAEAAPCEADPFATMDDTSTLDAVGVGAGNSTPAPAVALEVAVWNAVVNAAVPPVPNAAAEVGSTTPPPSFRVWTEVPEKMVVVPLSTT